MRLANAYCCGMLPTVSVADASASVFAVAVFAVGVADTEALSVQLLFVAAVETVTPQNHRWAVFACSSDCLCTGSLPDAVDSLPNVSIL